MTTVQISLPDKLARDAEKAGLLAPDFVERLLREELKTRRLSELFAEMDKTSDNNDLPYMSPEEIAEEIKAMRKAD